MIELKSNDQCCGCSACMHICPKHSISLFEDSEGFLYPDIDIATCVDCGLCESVCPTTKHNVERIPQAVYAAKHINDSIRLYSSSGGIFTLLAEQIIDEDGVVFGVRFNDNWEVIHDYVDTKEGLTHFRGSKYVQSRIGNAFPLVKSFLESGRKVMFVGTPCQISGLKKYLRKDWETLLTVDFVCHGVPSPRVWGKYLKEEVARQCGVNITSLDTSKVSNIVKGINFRDKSNGWEAFCFALNFSDSIVAKGYRSAFTDNVYMQTYLSNLTLRPSCYNCKVKSGKSGADITIGDFWGIDKVQPEFNDNVGVSLVMINEPSVMSFIEKSDFIPQAYLDAIEHNPAIISSANLHPYRNLFMKLFNHIGVSKAYWFCTSPNILCRILRKIYRLI